MCVMHLAEHSANRHSYSYIDCSANCSSSSIMTVLHVQYLVQKHIPRQFRGVTGAVAMLASVRPAPAHQSCARRSICRGIRLAAAKPGLRQRPVKERRVGKLEGGGEEIVQITKPWCMLQILIIIMGGTYVGSGRHPSFLVANA